LGLEGDFKKKRVLIVRFDGKNTLWLPFKRTSFRKYEVAAKAMQILKTTRYVLQFWQQI